MIHIPDMIMYSPPTAEPTLDPTESTPSPTLYPTLQPTHSPTASPITTLAVGDKSTDSPTVAAQSVDTGTTIVAVGEELEEEEEDSDVFQPAWVQLAAMITGGILCCACNCAVLVYVLLYRKRRNESEPGLAMVVDHNHVAHDPSNSQRSRSRGNSRSPRRGDRGSVRGSRAGSDRSAVIYSNVNHHHHGNHLDTAITANSHQSSYTQQSSLAPRPHTFGTSSSPGSSVAPSDRGLRGGDMKLMEDEEEGQLSDPGGSEVNMLAPRSAPRGVGSLNGMNPTNAMNPMNAAMSPMMGSLSPRRMLMMKPYEQWLVPDILVWINSLWTDNRFAPYVQRVRTNLNREGIGMVFTP